MHGSQSLLTHFDLSVPDLMPASRITFVLCLEQDGGLVLGPDWEHFRFASHAGAEEQRFQGRRDGREADSSPGTKAFVSTWSHRPKALIEEAFLLGCTPSGSK